MSDEIQHTLLARIARLIAAADLRFISGIDHHPTCATLQDRSQDPCLRCEHTRFKHTPRREFREEPGCRVRLPPHNASCCCPGQFVEVVCDCGADNLVESLILLRDALKGECRHLTRAEVEAELNSIRLHVPREGEPT